MKVESESSYHAFMVFNALISLSALTLLVVGILQISSHHVSGLSLLVSGSLLLPLTCLIFKKLQKGGSIVVQARKPLQKSPKTPYFEKEEDIRKMTEMSFLESQPQEGERDRCIVVERRMLISEIEKRAYSLQSHQSKIGFLSPHEKLTEVIANDWATVRQLGYTHEELANCLNDLMNFDLDKEGQTTSKVNYKGQNLELTYIRSENYQDCLFSLMSPWRDHCVIRSLKTKAQVIWTKGVEYYIREMGFYEGGLIEHNKYRVDPIHLISILTGEPIHSLRERANVTYPCHCSNCFVKKK